MRRFCLVLALVLVGIGCGRETTVRRTLTVSGSSTSVPSERVAVVVTRGPRTFPAVPQEPRRGVDLWARRQPGAPPTPVSPTLPTLPPDVVLADPAPELSGPGSVEVWAWLRSTYPRAPWLFRVTALEVEDGHARVRTDMPSRQDLLPHAQEACSAVLQADSALNRVTVSGLGGGVLAGCTGAG